MRVIIIGAGNAGRNLAAKLSEERHDITIVDCDEHALEETQSHLDIQTLQGEGCSPRVLAEAGVKKADLLVAVTNRDEVNMLACAFAHLAGVTNTVARVANADYIGQECQSNLQQLGLSLVVSEKEECAREIFTILRLPGTLEAVDMLGDRVLAVGIRVHMDSPIVLQTLKQFPEPDRLQRVRFIAVMRGGELIIPRGDTQFMIGDEVYLVATPSDVSDFLEWAYPEHSRFERIVIAGGGDIGLRLARMLEGIGMEVVLIERDPSRAEECSKVLDKSLVIRGDALDNETLENAGVIKGTAVVAVTGNDENNIMICLLGEKAGAAFTVAQVTKPEYVPIVSSLSLLDRAVSSHMSMINAILHFIRGKNVREAAQLHRLAGELLEIVVPEDSPWTSQAIKNVRVPPGVVIATVLRGEAILPATGELVLLPGDRLVLFARPDMVGKVAGLLRR